MDPFTQRMLERARLRQEKIDQKLEKSGQTPKRKPLTENIISEKPVKTPIKMSRRESCDNTENVLSPTKKVAHENQVFTSNKPSDIIVTRKEFDESGEARRDSNVSLEININHRSDVKIEVQVEERNAPLNIIYADEHGDSDKKLETVTMEKEPSKADSKSEKPALRHDVKSRLDRLGNLYSDTPNLSSPIHRTEMDFSSATPPSRVEERPAKPATQGTKKFGRLAALANQINNWEDDLTHHKITSDTANKATKKYEKKEILESSTLDVSINSLNDINNILSSADKAKQKSAIDSKTFSKNESKVCQPLNKRTVAELEGEGYRRVSAGQSRLVYDFASEGAESCRKEPNGATTPSAGSAPKMAAAALTTPAEVTITKKPSIKKYRAPTPPRNAEINKENTCQSTIDNETSEEQKCETNRGSVLMRAAMFEGSPKRERDPAEMSLRERKALFEKNKGAAIAPKAPFGLAPSLKALHGAAKVEARPMRPVVQPVQSAPLRPTQGSKENIVEETAPSGIKHKLAALMNKEQTISEAAISNRFKMEREMEMEMLHNRFHFKSKDSKATDQVDSDDDTSESENAPLMGSTLSLPQTNKKPEIIANVPKTRDNKNKTALERNVENGDECETDRAMQPAKRRSSQNSLVLAVSDETKRVKVTPEESKTGTPITNQPARIYPHLSDVEDKSQEEYSDCGGSSIDEVHNRMNKSDNWAESSFGREVMNVVKKNNTSYKKAVQDTDSSGDCESDLDGLLDEAINDESEGPTPPKVNKNSSLTSTSFVYHEAQFKSPLKMRPEETVTPRRPQPDRGAELVHTVSFYRRMQSASSTPTTPMRVVRHGSPEPDTREAREHDAARATTVRERIKELQAEIAKQHTVISQASQALNLCASTVEFSGSTEQAEGERLLLLATHRRQACSHEVQRLQVEGAGAARAGGEAALRMRRLALPLRRDYLRQIQADDGVGHYCVCLVKCRDRVLATSMQHTQPKGLISPPSTIQFPDDIRMEGITSDFKVTIEVYLLQASKEVLPHEVKYHISNKKSNSKLLTPKSKVSEMKSASATSSAAPARTPQFQLHGYCIFALAQADRKTFTLSKVPCGSPLDGNLQVVMTARVSVPPPAPHSAFLTAFDEVSGLGAWHRRWFRLQPPRLAYWKYPDDVNKKMPIGDIDFTTVISERITKAPRDLCARPNTLLLECSVPTGLIIPDSGSLVYFRKPDGTTVRRHLLAADTPKDRDEWLDCLNRALEYVRCSGNEDFD